MGRNSLTRKQAASAPAGCARKGHAGCPNTTPRSLEAKALRPAAWHLRAAGGRPASFPPVHDRDSLRHDQPTAITDDSGPSSRSILCARRRRSGLDGWVPAMAVIDDVRPLGAELERSYTVYVRGRLKFRVGQIVYVAFSLDETVMGFGFPKEERAALVLSEPHKFQLPSESDLRFN